MGTNSHLPCPIISKKFVGFGRAAALYHQNVQTENQELLAEYVKTGSEGAFRELIARYLDLVYSTAVRLVEGDRHRAQDVTQTVFADFARLARTFSSGVMLGGWLHRHTCYVASTMLRGERRRQDRERQVAEMNAVEDHSEANLASVAPILDEAINQLGAEDRTAILLRFFERNDFRAIGKALGSNEDAAQKRVTRALEKLQGMLKQRGVAFSVAGLGTLLTAEAVTAAPAGLALTVSTVALAGAGGATATITILKLMTMTKLKIGIAAVVAAGVATPLVLQYQSAAKLRADNQTLREQADNLKAELDRLAQLAAKNKEMQAQADDRLAQLLALRNEVGALRKQTNEVNRLQAQNQQLQASLNAARKSQPGSINAPDKPENQNEFPRDKWVYSGYGTPEDAAQTMAWAAINGEIGVVTNSVAPELLGQIQQMMAAGKFESEFLAGMREDVNTIASFRVVNRENLPDNMIRLTVAIPGKGERNPVLKKVGNEWKFVKFN